jgi:hypothetical protein
MGPKAADHRGAATAHEASAGILVREAAKGTEKRLHTDIG